MITMKTTLTNHEPTLKNEAHPKRLRVSWETWVIKIGFFYFIFGI